MRRLLTVGLLSLAVLLLQVGPALAGDGHDSKDRGKYSDNHSESESDDLLGSGKKPPEEEVVEPSESEKPSEEPSEEESEKVLPDEEEPALVEETVETVEEGPQLGGDRL